MWYMWYHMHVVPLPKVGIYLTSISHQYGLVGTGRWAGLEGWALQLNLNHAEVNTFVRLELIITLAPCWNS